jgi:hypothetical protein
MPRCTAKSKQSGEQCKRHASIGRTVCAIHGGKIPRGHALPQTTHGRYSKHLPTRMLANYVQSRDDPEMLALSNEIALIDSRTLDLLNRVDSGESGAIWRDLQATYKELREANQAGDVATARQLLLDLGSLITKGHADYAAWVDVRLLIEQRRKLVESERKRLVDMQQMITAEQAMLLISRLHDTVMRHVDDPGARAAIADDLGRLTLQSTRGAD